MVHKRFEENISEFEVFPTSHSNGASVGCAGQTSPIQGGPTSELKGLEGSFPNIMMPDTTAYLQMFSGVHVSVGQGWGFFVLFSDILLLGTFA